MGYLSLDPRRIIETAESLERRIGERFSASGLQRVAGELVGVARRAAERSERIRRPNRFLQAGIAALALSFLAIVGLLLAELRIQHEELTMSELIQDIDAFLSSAVFIGASALFLFTLDARWKRRRVLEAIHELRSLAHIVDMHQLTKDPEMVVAGSERTTTSSPARKLDRFELGRYLDYSSEMLSIISKVAALYVQGFEDSASISAVDEVESLTTGLSRKIWQKITLLDRTPQGG
jgi:hypothetical protein